MLLDNCVKMTKQNKVKIKPNIRLDKDGLTKIGSNKKEAYKKEDWDKISDTPLRTSLLQILFIGYLVYREI